MRQPRKWWIGLPVLAGLAYAAAQTLIPQIEAALKAELAERLSVAPERISVVGRDVAISGAAIPPEQIAALRTRYGLRKISAAGVSAPVVAPATGPETPKATPPHEPYAFSATLGDSFVALDGKLPSGALQKRAVVLAAASGAGLAVSDGTKIDADSPQGDYAAALDVALDALRRLASGKVSLVEGKLAVEGRGRENVRAETLSAELRSRLPQGFELAVVDVAPGPVSPYLFHAAREGYKTVLAGFVPDDSARDRILDNARRRFFDSIVEDQLSVATGAPDKFADAAIAGLAALARMESGELSMSNGDMTLSGAVRYEGARDAIAKSFESGLPKDFKGETRLVARALGPPLDASGCRAAFSELSKTPIRFENDDAISDESGALLDALTVAVLRCPTAAIEVAGHVDDQGDPELDRLRSKRRAALVVERFLAAGADSFHVWAMGYGGERPVAPNDGEANRARNRRIEFNVK